MDKNIVQQKIQNGIVFIKTAKSASESVSHILDIVSNCYGLKTNSGQNYSPKRGEANLQHLQWRQYENKDDLDRLFITTIRDPFERMKSHFRHHRDYNKKYKKYGNNFGKWYRENQDLKLESTFEGVNNYISQYTGIKNETDILRYDFVFIAEFLPRQIKYFSKIFDCELPHNISRNKKITHDELYWDVKDKELFLENNKLDYMIFRECTKKFLF
jgi:hypothetical protein